MAHYAYVALDSRGQESTGSVEANSTSEAINQLRQTGYFPTSVYEESTGRPPENSSRRVTTAPRPVRSSFARKEITFFQRKKIKSKTLMIFTRQLATLIDSGLPLLRGLNVLAKQERDAVLKKAINQLADSIQGGGTFSEGLAQHPNIFNDLYVTW
jgi:type IV pilus assembly protein PilC